MDTLHKKLSELRDLRSDELDLVGGADEGSNQTVDVEHYNTLSYIPGHPNSQVDDGTTQVFYDNAPIHP